MEPVTRPGAGHGGSGAVVRVQVARALAIGAGSILLTNHAFVTGVNDPSQFTVLDVVVNDYASPLELPIIR